MDDRVLRDKILAELGREPSVEAGSVIINVRDGVVTVGGQVCSPGEKLRIEEAIRRADGVRGFAEDIRVSGFDSLHDDTALATRIAETLGAIRAPASVKVQVEKGKITLSGEVDQADLRRIVEQEVRRVAGASDIHNQITLRSRVPPGDAKGHIAEALQREDIDASAVRIDVRDGHVTLTGAVRTWFDRDTVQRVAWSAPGVQAVDDRLVITEDGEPPDVEIVP